MQPVERQFRDTLFSDMFGSEDRKAYALSLYNALNGSDFDDESAIELVTIDHALYLAKRHDVAFLIGDRAVLWEQQSTPNPNMPLRALMYFAQLYERYVRTHVPRGMSAAYGTRLIRLPAARFVVFYLGRAERPEREELRLSDAFGGEPADVEARAAVLNLGEGMNEGLKRACPPLAEYAALVGRAFELEPALGRDAAVAAAVDERIAAGVIADYLRDRKKKVIGMLFEEYDEAEVMAIREEQAREDGMAEGLEKGLEKGWSQCIEILERGGGIEDVKAAFRKLGKAAG